MKHGPLDAPAVKLVRFFAPHHEIRLLSEGAESLSAVIAKVSGSQRPHWEITVVKPQFFLFLAEFKEFAAFVAQTLKSLQNKAV